MMNVRLLAEIIQGEAGSMGPIGMMAVAMSLSCRIWQNGHDEARIAREWYGRAEPETVAIFLADMVAMGELPENPYFWCMGHGPDVEEQNMRRGDWVIMNHDNDVGLHLYYKDNVPYERPPRSG